ncbi:copper transporter [Actinomyces vulturis]|uniref:copper transporter n=1 Tax=Actinomyces vulturis TaxID=1857645 RepID=UPI00082A7566|nr:copper transporter [Actinomyces vulturis]
MIDFRYHLVSLISVFMALAVGVVLGAGPLQGSLGNALADQVDSLSATKAATQSQLEKTETAVNQRDTYIAQAAQDYLPGSLTNHHVVLVLLPGAQGEDVDVVAQELETASASVVGRVTLTQAWEDPGRETFRNTYAGQFSAYLPSSAGAATGNEALGQGLAVALTSNDPNADALTDLLTASDSPLLSGKPDLSEPADMIVIVGPHADVDSDAIPSPSPDEDPNAWTAAVKGINSIAATVVLGSAVNDNDLISLLRQGDSQVTTIDSVGQMPSAVSVPLALASMRTEGKRAYGFASSATAVMPPLPGKN